MTNRAALRRMNDTATVWPATGDTDDYGFPIYGTPYTISCNFLQGGKLAKDDKGDDFMPQSTIRTLDTRPKIDDLIVLGDQSGIQNPQGTGAQRIRKRAKITNFRGIVQSIPLLTG